MYNNVINNIISGLAFVVLVPISIVSIPIGMVMFAPHLLLFDILSKNEQYYYNQQNLNN